MMMIPAYSSSIDSASKKKFDEETKEYKSKNLVAERKRRQKLSDRLLELRSLCPNITNMNKATIITDAITYVEELKQTVDDLSNELTQMDASIKGEFLTSQINNGIHEVETEIMRSCNIVETEVHVRHLNGNKLWIHITCLKKIGTLSRLLEAINALGLHVQDTSVTTTLGAFLFTACLEAVHGGFVEVTGIREFMMETLRSI